MTNSIISKKFRGDILAFIRFLSRLLTRSIHIGWIFFLYFFLGNQNKQENTVFDYKNGPKFKNNITFEKVCGWLYNESALTFEVKSLWKDLQPKVHFSLVFYVQKLKKHKIHFLVTKSGQKLNLMSFSDPRPKICVFFICQFFFWWIFSRQEVMVFADFSAHFVWHG